MPSDVRIMSLEKYLINSIGKNNDDSVSVRKIDSTLMISTDKGAISVEECEANQWEIKYFHFDPNLKAILDSKAPIATIFGKSWILHIEKQLKAPERKLELKVSDEFVKRKPVIKEEKILDEEIYKPDFSLKRY